MAMLSACSVSKMLLNLALIHALVGFACAAKEMEKPVHMKWIAKENFKDYVGDGDSVKVIYFYNTDLPGLKHFLTEMQKSSPILELYGADFALVDCMKDSEIGYCEVADSSSRVYMYRKGRMLLDISINTMFDINSIVSNVLQVVMLYDAPILQSAAERERLELENKGSKDVVFSYQKALGTYAHRVLMEIVYVYHSHYRFGITNEHETVRQLPGFSENEESAIWLLRCKMVTDVSQPCPALKYIGIVDREAIATFFQVLDLPTVLVVSRDEDANAFENNQLHTVFMYYDMSTEHSASMIAAELADVFLSRLGVLKVNIEATAKSKMGYMPEWKLPALVVKLFGEDKRRHMEDGDVPVRFVAEQIGSVALPSMQPLESTETMQNTVSHVGMDMVNGQMSEKQDDEVAEAVTLMPKIKMEGESDDAPELSYVTELTSGNFFSVTGDHHMNPIMVVFYVKFGARSDVFRSVYNEAATELASDGYHPLAAINCYDWTDTCQMLNISSYPTLRIYHSDGAPVEYLGYLSKSAIISTMTMWINVSPVKLHTSSEVEMFMQGKHPHNTERVYHVFGGFMGQTAEMSTFEAVSKLLRGKMLFGLSTDSAAEMGCRHFDTTPPCIVVIRNGDSVSPFSVLSPLGTAGELTLAIERASLSLLPELRADNFADYYALNRPFVIAFLRTEELPADGGNFLAILLTLSREDPWRNNAVFAWMNVSSKDQAALTILKQHVDNPRSEELLIIDHSKGTVHHFPTDTSATVNTVRDWLAAVLSGTLVATKSLSMEEWNPRSEPYDFLALMDADEAAAAASSSSADPTEEYIKRINEEGLEFEDNDQMPYHHSPVVQKESKPFDLPAEVIDEAVKKEMEKLKQSRLYDASQFLEHEADVGGAQKTSEKTGREKLHATGHSEL